ncbi:MAG TPA: DNA-binding response regulator [Elusimicrobia bacterium]|nr:DNA-binding response regulator [Elusimicrobiota bacterium]HBT60238.1 DNA-binding response regulator [Elusimicrobiota bacterium]
MAPEMKAQILVCEDQPATSDLISEVLQDEGCEIQVVESLAKARKSLTRALPDLMILDRNLPDGEGLELLKELRTDPRTSKIPVLVLTGQNAVTDKVAGLREGADDYITKPFHTEELVARVETLLRRVGTLEEPAMQEAGELKLDRGSRKAFVKNKEVPLSAKEFDLLWFLMHRRNRVMTRDFLLQHVWGYEQGLDLSTKVIDVTLSHLREKIGPTADKIVSVRGFGYRFDD